MPYSGRLTGPRPGNNRNFIEAFRGQGETRNIECPWVLIFDQCKIKNNRVFRPSRHPFESIQIGSPCIKDQLCDGFNAVFHG
jgi:hypothetical protein